MTATAQKETLDFQAEVSQVLNLVIRSLYSNKEIFLRELVSNASDAAEKLRFEALGNDALYEDDSVLRIRVSVDKDAGTVTILDNGIGMSRQEVNETIGSIASSGTRKFLDKLSGDKAKDAQLIGQFGVGFYSAFIVADKVTLSTRRAGMRPDEGVRWESTGEGTYTIENVERPERGTEIVLHLRDDEKEFLDAWRLRSIIGKFSDHIAIPIEMLQDVPPAAEDEAQAIAEWEQVNTGTALWVRNKSEISDDDYKAFYKNTCHDFEEPLAWAHNRVEGKHEYTSLLFLPSRAPFDMWDREQKHGVKLYVRRVFIMDEADKLMPHYLRFVKGVVDSDDLPLNVSREILQHDKKIDSIRSANVKRVLGLLEKMAKDDDDKYQAFWKQFGKVLKEGPAEDFANREKIAALLRFASTKSDGDAQTVSLDAYLERMTDKQEKIYYITADTLAAARNSPHLEVFKKKDIEVLLLTDRVDEWLVSHLTEFKGKSLQSVAKGSLDLGDLEDQEEKEKVEKATEENKHLIERIQTALGDAVKAVRVSSRLTESPACLVVDEHDMSQNLARVLKQLGQDAPLPTPIIEVNLDHPLMKRMDTETDEDKFSELARIVFDQALLAEGGQLDDPAGFVHRLNRLMLDMSA
ncbi:MAG: molecular chaperone HtpG [Gammaproteobacteria bacterium]|nr:molecular chaperone HtpG [Gammaproteobacteria bacterium]